jgi:hypothetical protein
MSNRLILHCGAFPVVTEEIAMVPVPEKTDTYQPLSHLEMLEWVLESADRVNLKPKMHKLTKPVGFDVAGNPITYEYEQPYQVGMNKNGSRMFFLVDFESDHLAHSFAIGGRNSYDKSMAAGLTAGARNFICDNLAFSGDYKVLQKHVTGTDFRSMINGAMEAMPRSMEQFIANIERTKTWEFLREEDAKSFLIDAAKQFVIPSSDIIPVWKEFENPTHEEFAETYSQYRMLQAFTQVVKGESSASTTFQRYGRFSSLFRLDENDLN